MIFLDEPTSGLDSEMACQVMDSLISLARRDRLVRFPPRDGKLYRCGSRWPCRVLDPTQLASRLSQVQLGQQPHRDSARLLRFDPHV